ncbi:MAG: hypothetical protein HYU97_01515 [Deltaproteobacteria bacterium]|nr:hypothetical protein [Deltaproteobacteria bacterium]
MQATTIKLEGPILSEIKKILPKDKSLTSYVRGVLEQELRRQKMLESANDYLKFLADNPEEQTWLEEWQDLDLAKAPQLFKRKK